MARNLFERVFRQPPTIMHNAFENQFTESLAAVLETVPGLAVHWLRTVLGDQGEASDRKAWADALKDESQDIEVQTQRPEGRDDGSSKKFIDLSISARGPSSWIVWIEVKLDAGITWSRSIDCPAGERSLTSQLDNYLMLQKGRTELGHLRAVLLASKVLFCEGVPEQVHQTTWFRTAHIFQRFLESRRANLVGEQQWLVSQFLEWMRRRGMSQDRSIGGVRERQVAAIGGFVELRQKLLRSIVEAWEELVRRRLDLGGRIKDIQDNIIEIEKSRPRLTAQLPIDGSHFKVVFGYELSVDPPVACCWVVADLPEQRKVLHEKYDRRIAALDPGKGWKPRPDPIPPYAAESPDLKHEWWFTARDRPLMEFLADVDDDHVRRLARFFLEGLEDLLPLFASE
jgi:hypothetical protein